MSLPACQRRVSALPEHQSLRQRSLWQVCYVSLVFLLMALPAAALTAEQIAIVVNRSLLESVNVGHYYAERRAIPAAQVIALDLGPLRETIQREEYEQAIVAPLRQALEARGLTQKIRALVTVYGIPLRVLAPQPGQQEQRWRADAQERQQKAWEELKAMAQRLQIAVEEPTTGAYAGQTTDFLAASNALIPRLQEAIRAVGSTSQHAFPALSSAERQQLQRQLTGYVMIAPNEAMLSAEEKQETQRRLQLVQAMLQTLRSRPSELHRERIYILLREAFGLQGVLRYAASEWRTGKEEVSEASVDNELSILWWDETSYRLAGRLINPLHHSLQRRLPLDNMPAATLMVSRLDAPTADLARQLVDRAMTAERKGLDGKVYIDARGLSAAKAAPLSYAFYDESLRNTAALFRQATSYLVISENTPERFRQPGQAPDVAVYTGWYALRSYEDAFTFKNGAIGWHIASGEAVSIHDPREPGWCKNALERGITVTLGPVTEPYLDAFPLPEEFFGLLLTGRYALVEAYYLTLRYVSWQMVLFGDPLYNPWRTRKYQPESRFALYPAAQPEQARLPEAPANLPLTDPMVERQEHLRRQQALLAQYDTLLHVLRRTASEP